MTLDVVFLGGQVIDGSGSRPYQADVGIADGRIGVIGQLQDAGAARTVDAAGLYVAPGFIDPHAHAETLLLDGPAGPATIRQGVTTHVLAADGFGYAPLSPARLQQMRAHMAPFQGEPAVGWDWYSLGDYLARYERRSPVNVVGQVSHHAVRLEALGWEARQATPAELEQMRELTRQGMAEGAVGFATGLDYFPGGHADTEELIELCKVVAGLGGLYTAHVRYAALGGVVEATREAIRVGKEAGIPIHLSHFYGDADLFELIERAGAEGVDITFDSYPYLAGVGQLVGYLPAWAQTGPPEQVLARLSDPSVRERLRPALVSGLRPAEHWDTYFISGIESERNRHIQGRTLADFAGRNARRLVDFVCDLLIEERLRVLLIDFWLTEEQVQRSLTHPLQMVLSDAVYRGKPHPRAYGTFPRILAHYVRELGLLSWEDAVRRMSGFPAQRFGLKDRGLLREGLAADLVLFDPQRVADRATYAEPELPPVGIPYVLVNGEFVVDGGCVTGKTPGRVLRK